MSGDAPPQPLNVVFFGAFPYPSGMAGTRRVQHAIDGLRLVGACCSVVVTRQTTALNPPSGTQDGVPYTTLLPNCLGWRLLLKLPALALRSRAALCKAKRTDMTNILYVYGPPSVDSALTVGYARANGFSVVFDIAEDYDAAGDIASGLKHALNVRHIQLLNRKLLTWASGLVVISPHLREKFLGITGGALPILLRPISVDPKGYTSIDQPSGNPRLFYSGSFGLKDGLDELISAFEAICQKHPGAELVMTGRGTPERMKHLARRLSSSPARNRISYLGYLDDQGYSKALASCSIACVTRVGTDYANAGFPFKLGDFLASGIPVVCSDVSYVRELLVDREDLVLVKPGCVPSLVRGIEYLVEQPDTAVRIGANGRRRALALFDYRAQGRELAAFLQRLEPTPGRKRVTV